jgi:hypothetical protein
MTMNRRLTHRTLAGKARSFTLLAGICLLVMACESGDDTTAQPESIEPAATGGKAGAGSAEHAPTWNQDIAPIVIPKCSGCHQPGSIAPFSLLEYENAKPFAAAMAAAVMSGRMPPFLAQDTDECHPRFPWAYDIRLDDNEKALIQSWADAGAPEGKAVTEQPKSPPLPKLEREDAVITIPQAVEVSGNRDIHTCMLVDPELLKDEYVVGRLIKPGNPKIVHHVVSYVVNPGMNSEGGKQTKAELEAQVKALHGVGIGGRYDCFGGPALEGMSFDILDVWAPGSLPNVAPPNSGQPVAKDSLLLFDLHYHPNGDGSETDDSTSMALMFADEKPELVSLVLLLGNFEKLQQTEVGDGDLIKQSDEDAAEFMIPANAKQHVEEVTWKWKLPAGSFLRVYAIGTHMHYVGRDELVTLERAHAVDGEPDEECLIQTPAWDFNWQHGYAYDTDYEHYPSMRDGDTLHMRCTYDNTLDNPFMRKALDEQGLDHPIDVPLGEDTLDEMCVAGVGVIAPNP